MARSLSAPKRTTPSRVDRDALLLMAGAVTNNATDYRTILKMSPETAFTLNMARLNRTRAVFESFLQEKGIFGSNRNAMEINELTQKAIDWAWNDLRREFGWGAIPSKSDPVRMSIRISTENFLAIHLMPKVISAFSERNITFEIRESASLYAAIDDHIRHGTDLVIHTLRKSKGREKPSMPKLEGLKPENLSDETKFSLRDTVWFPKSLFDGLNSKPDESKEFAAGDLAGFPVALVGYPEAVKELLTPRGSQPRIVVSTNEAMRRFVEQGYVGVGQNWPPMPEHIAVSRPFNWNRPVIDICLCYRLPKRFPNHVNAFVKQLKSCLASEAQRLVAT